MTFDFDGPLVMLGDRLTDDVNLLDQTADLLWEKIRLTLGGQIGNGPVRADQLRDLPMGPKASIALLPLPGRSGLRRRQARG